MDLMTTPLLLFLILPGFISINVGFLVTGFRRLSGLQGTARSLVTSLVLFVLVYPTFTLINGTETNWPGLMDMLRTPTSIPGGLFAGLYIAAPILGLIGGQIVHAASKSDRVGKALLLLGVDIKKHSDIWDRVISQPSYLRVYLNDGDLLHGWNQFYSIGLTDHDREIYLTRAFVWDANNEDWVKFDDDTGILLSRDSISRIEIIASHAQEDEDKGRHD